MVDLTKTDIVYFVKEDMNNEELRFSLRSVEKNFPHNKVWIYGGCPSWMDAEHLVRVNQKGNTKWDRVKSMLRQVCVNKAITEDFVLFNDDFFVMKPVKTLEPMYRCSLFEHIVTIEMNYNDSPTEYTKQLRNATRTLLEAGCSTNSYELHMPMVINRLKMLQILGGFPNEHCTRTLYGNFHEIGGKKTDDVKIYNKDQRIDTNSTFLSTSDNTFRSGGVGDYIKNKFTEKSKFEK